MRTQLILLFFILSGLSLEAQLPSAKAALEKSIAFHDPEGLWYSSQINLKLKGEYASGMIVESDVKIYMPTHDFVLKQNRAERVLVREIHGDSCFHSLDGSTDIRPEEKMRMKLTCKQTARTRNYNIYLYGLPMKLLDESAMLDPEVQKAKLEGKDYHVLTVRYAPEVGQDIWKFYLDPSTYEMKAYQFYKDESNQKGEMIFLEKLSPVGSMKLPKERTWYDWPEKKLLGKDIVESGSVIPNTK